MSTPNAKSIGGDECIDVNLECSKEDEHTFFARIREEDLMEA